MSVNRGGEAVFRIPHEASLHPECTSLSCELSAIATEPGVVTTVVFAGLLVFVAFAYLRDAEAACRQERRRVMDEHDAFEEFADRIAALDPCHMDATDRPAGPIVETHRPGNVGGAGTGDVRLRRVLDTYQNTVMALPHYTEEYDESVTESIAAELGRDTTVSLASNGTLSPGLQSALVDRSRQAARARRSLADAIEAEVDALSDAETTLSGIERQRSRLNDHLDGISHGARADASIDVWLRLNELERECDAVATERQDALRDPPVSPDRSSGVDAAFHEYLYAPTEGPKHPVLATVASVGDRIREDRARVARQIAGGT
ncbi:MAG: hypothetical protein A07HR67_02864 [uncultured archaeon A07HR67]|jgi:hypothetical protein|nr:MAG: hypothetical protein A07HR67_02864 [uncultured archaeon A07HR67]